MTLPNNIKLYIHRLMYWGSFFLPLGYIWGKLHSSDYHPNLGGIKTRISKSKSNPNNSLFHRWSVQLDYPLVVRDKTVLEIGHGGAWYLAEALDAGAKNVVGYEISDELNQRASIALKQLGYSNFELIDGNGKDLEVIKKSRFDFIYSITVLQHLPTRTTKRYLRDIVELLEVDGIFIVQTLHSHGKSMKRLSGVDLFSVAYSRSEFSLLLKQAGLKQVSYSELDYGSKETFWGIYLLTK